MGTGGCISVTAVRSCGFAKCEFGFDAHELCADNRLLRDVTALLFAGCLSKWPLHWPLHGSARSAARVSNASPAVLLPSGVARDCAGQRHGRRARPKLGCEQTAYRRRAWRRQGDTQKSSLGTTRVAAIQRKWCKRCGMAVHAGWRCVARGQTGQSGVGWVRRSQCTVLFLKGHLCG